MLMEIKSVMKNEQVFIIDVLSVNICIKYVCSLWDLCVQSQRIVTYSINVVLCYFCVFSSIQFYFCPDYSSCTLVVLFYSVLHTNLMPSKIDIVFLVLCLEACWKCMFSKSSITFVFNTTLFLGICFNMQMFIVVSLVCKSFCVYVLVLVCTFLL